MKKRKRKSKNKVKRNLCPPMFNTLKHVITTIHEDRGYKLCQCFQCKGVSKCTPENDFYSTDHHGDKLLCESCFKKYLRSQHGINDMVEFIDDGVDCIWFKPISFNQISEIMKNKSLNINQKES